MTNSVTTFDLWQQVFCISMQACLIGSQKQTGTADALTTWLAERLASFFAANEAQMGGRWSTVWGPVVFETGKDADKGIADNVMVVAANADRSVFVVAIAGTNFASQDYDVKLEDDAVDTTSEWTAAFPALANRAPSGLKPYISGGAQLGVSNLLAMTDGRTGKTLADYLASAASEAATLIVAGHSLGGALAPTLTMALFNSNGGKLDKSEWKDVHFFATAGPTPGNADFSRYVAQEFPPVGPVGAPYQCWNKVVWNSLDVVPQGWVVELLKGLPELYAHAELTPLQKPWPPKDLQDLVDGKIKKSNAGAATGAGPYAQLANQCLEGTLYVDHVQCKVPVPSTPAWTAQMQYQHMAAYNDLLGFGRFDPSKPTAAPADRAD